MIIAVAANGKVNDFMNYICIKSFCVDKCDGDGFLTYETELIEIETLWYRDDDTNIIGGEVHLESINGNLGWIEISSKTLKENFMEVNVND